MARHRSPLGRRAHLGPPLHAVTASAGVGGAHRSFSPPQPSPWQLALFQSALPQQARSLPARFVATAVAGGLLAAAGQHALSVALPAAADGANVLRLGVEGLLGTAASDQVPPAAQPLVTVAPVAPLAPVPAVADVGDLVKAAELQRLTAEDAARVAAQARAAEAAAEKARIADEARAGERARTTPATRPADADRAATPAPAAAPRSPAPPAAAPSGGAVQLVVGRVSSGFGLRGGTLHQGLDIAAPIGTPIRVPLDGTVISSGPASGFGLWVRVRHADGTITVYGHINRSLVTVGERVSAGQVIAEVGNRGQSTGPHLHIEVITPAGTKIDPRPWLDERGIGY